MKKATRILLKHRPKAQFITVENVILEGALANHCYQNAVKFADMNEKDLLVVSGWLVGDFFGERGTAVIPHYFVANEKTRKYYEPTPFNDRQNYEYVLDIEIMTLRNGKAILPLPLKITANGLLQARSDDGKRYIDLHAIDITELYRLVEDN